MLLKGSNVCALLTYRMRRVPGISAVPHEDNLRYFDVTVHGPSQSPYEGMLSQHFQRSGAGMREFAGPGLA